MHSRSLRAPLGAPPAPDRHRRRLLSALALLPLAGCGPDAPKLNGMDLSSMPAGDFQLQDTEGRQRRLADYRGKTVMLFFGFTQCPDICPTALTRALEIKNLLGADAAKLQVLFITVDPERDTPAVLREYVTNFDPSFLALYAAPDALPELAKSYKIYYKKVNGPTPTSYSMDHSAGSYVYDPQGRIRLYNRYGTGAGPLAADVKKLLDGA